MNETSKARKKAATKRVSRAPSTPADGSHAEDSADAADVNESLKADESADHECCDHAEHLDDVACCVPGHPLTSYVVSGPQHVHDMPPGGTVDLRADDPHTRFLVETGHLTPADSWHPAATEQEE